MNITVDRAVIEQALEALEQTTYAFMDTEGNHGQIEVDAIDASHKAITAIREALAQPEQEPVAWMLKSGHGAEFNECIAEELKALTWKGKPMWVPLYDAPPQRKPLMDEEIAAIYGSDLNYRDGDYLRYARAIEAAHGIKEPT